nr:FimV/HubP family polar landmark protein [Stenotrophomonas pictorum]
MRSIQGVLVLILALFSSAAMALGLGDIRVLSKPGQPFLAEIPIISSDPGELENATVGLASPVTFERVGLARPQGLVSELQFQFAQDREGRAVIRVTSAAPVQVPALGFLIEVDWGQGRLVREYSALVAAPETATAVAEPVIEAPAAAPSNLIVREPEPLREAPLPNAPAAPAAAPATPAPAPARPAAQVPGQLAPVQRGQSLSQVARELSRESGTSLNQTMVALMRANPEAFIRGNIHLLKQGAVLRTPSQEELARVDAAEARAMVREQTAQWRQARAPVPQPAVADAAAQPARSASPAAAATGARLEIAAAAAGAQQTAGMTTGLDAGGEGDMLANEQLRQAKEDLATRDAELQELRDRVGELEKLQQQQQALIAMKDSDLAAAQMRLAEAGRREDGASLGWLWLGLILVVVAALGWWLARRRKPLPPAPRRDFGADGLVAAMPVMGMAADQVDDQSADVARGRDSGAEAVMVQPVAEDHVAVQPDAYEEPMPAWLRGGPAIYAEPLPPTVEPAPAALGEASPPVVEAPELSAIVQAEVPESAWDAADTAPVAPLSPAPAGRERLELAIAYLDLGDAETARTLLGEVMQGGDPQARDEALELLGRMR